MKFVNENIADKIKQHYKTNKIVATNFLDPSEIVSILGELKGVDNVIWGGYETAERKIILIGTDSENYVSYSSDFLTVIRVSLNPKNLEGTLSHRSVLGSLIGLGIKREMIGDIIVQDNFCDIIVSKNMREFILANFDFVGRNKIEVKEISINEVSIPKDSSKEIKTTVSSLRLDCIISAGYSISREKSISLVKSEFVKLNHVIVKSAVKQIREGDLISVRGKGRLEVREIGGTSKSGRIKILLAKK